MRVLTGNGFVLKGLAEKKSIKGDPERALGGLFLSHKINQITALKPEPSPPAAIRMSVNDPSSLMGANTDRSGPPQAQQTLALDNIQPLIEEGPHKQS